MGNARIGVVQLFVIATLSVAALAAASPVRLTTPDGRVVVTEEAVFIRPAALIAVDPEGPDDGVGPAVHYPEDALGPAGNGRTARVIIRDDVNRFATLTVDIGTTVSRGQVLARMWHRGYQQVRAQGAVARGVFQTLGDFELCPYRIEWRAVEFDDPLRLLRLRFRTPPGLFNELRSEPDYGEYPQQPPPGYHPLPDSYGSKSAALWVIDALCVKVPLDGLAPAALRNILSDATGVAVNGPINRDVVRQLATDSQAARAESLLRLCRSRGHRGAVGFAFVGSTTPVTELADVPEPAVGRAGEVALAGNETEAIQLVLFTSDERFDNIDIQIDDLVGPGGQRLPGGQINWGLIRDVANTVDPSRPYWPDWISPVGEPFPLEAGQVQRLWLTVSAPADQPAGLYHGDIKIRARNRVVAQVGLDVRVWGFTLPNQLHFDTMNQHGGDLDIMLDHHFCPGAVAVPRYLLQPDGSIDIDFEEYDEKLAEARRKGMKNFRIHKEGRVWHLHQEFIDVPSGEKKTLSLWNADGKQRLAEFISIWGEHLKHKGWLEDCVFYLWDEPEDERDDQIVAQGRVIHQAYSELKTLVTTVPRANLDEVVDIYVPSARAWLFEESHRRIAWARHHGKTIWWYTGADNYPAPVFGRIGYSPVYWRIHPWMNWRFEVPGSLYSGFDFFGDPPEAPGIYGRMGVMMLYYPDKGLSIRFEMIRDGIEDYEYLAMLDELTKADPNHPARRLLEIPEDLITSLTQYDLRPEGWIAHRRKLAQAIEAATGQ